VVARELGWLEHCRCRCSGSRCRDTAMARTTPTRLHMQQRQQQRCGSMHMAEEERAVQGSSSQPVRGCGGGPGALSLRRADFTVHSTREGWGVGGSEESSRRAFGPGVWVWAPQLSSNQTAPWNAFETQCKIHAVIQMHQSANGSEIPWTDPSIFRCSQQMGW
jgi:hypothetical protein